MIMLSGGLGRGRGFYRPLIWTAFLSSSDTETYSTWVSKVDNISVWTKYHQKRLFVSLNMEFVTRSKLTFTSNLLKCNSDSQKNHASLQLCKRRLEIERTAPHPCSFWHWLVIYKPKLLAKISGLCIIRNCETGYGILHWKMKRVRLCGVDIAYRWLSDCTASTRSGQVHSLPWGGAMRLFPYDFGDDLLARRSLSA